MGLFDDVAKFGKDIGKATFDAAIAGKESWEAKKEQDRIEYMHSESERLAYEAKLSQIAKNVIVTTGDLKQDYEIVCPIFFQVTNMGIFGNKFKDLERKYASEVNDLEKNEVSLVGEVARRLLFGVGSPEEGNFERAFYIGIEELKRKAIILGGNAVINLAPTINFTTGKASHFFLQMYATAVKIKE